MGSKLCFIIILYSLHIQATTDQIKYLPGYTSVTHFLLSIRDPNRYAPKRQLLIFYHL